MSDSLPTRVEIAPEDLSDNVFRAIGSDWMLITAGTRERFNTMTASWGAMGVLWGKPVAFVVVRPHRYTYRFLEAAGSFTLSFFAEEWRAALQLCGSKSGRDIDKMAVTGLKPVASPSGSVYFTQARLVLDCRKLYFQDFDPANFVDSTLDASIYPTHDYHRLYVGEIEHCWRQ